MTSFDESLRKKFEKELGEWLKSAQIAGHKGDDAMQVALQATSQTPGFEKIAEAYISRRISPEKEQKEQKEAKNKLKSEQYEAMPEFSMKIVGTSISHKVPWHRIVKKDNEHLEFCLHTPSCGRSKK